MGDIGGAFELLMKVALFGVAAVATGVVLALASIWIAIPLWIAVAIMFGVGLASVPIAFKAIGR